MNDVSRIVSGDVLRTAQAARHHIAPQAKTPQEHAESRALAPAKNTQPAGPGTPPRDAPRGSHLDILV